MKRIAIILGFLVGLISVGPARADLTQVNALGGVGTSGFEVRTLSQARVSLESSPSAQAPQPMLDLSLAAPPEIFHGLSKSAPTETLVIDGPPGSLGLFLSGLLTLGAWHAGRSAAHWHPQGGWLPEWYHTGGPVQVGHAVPFDFHTSMAAVCDFDAGIAGFHNAPIVAPPERFDRRAVDPFLLADPVRGPPAL